MKRILFFAALLCFPLALPAQVQVSLPPNFRPQFADQLGKPLAGGKLWSYAAGTSNPLTTYSDASGTFPNTNPIVLDAGGFPSCSNGNGLCGIWLTLNTYKICLYDASGVQQWGGCIDNVSDLGVFYLKNSLLLNPPGGATQTVTGQISANSFNQTTAHVTSSGVRVNILDPATILDTATNPPTLATTAPALTGQTYQVPDPGTFLSNMVLNPSPPNWITANAYTLTQTIVPYANNPCNFTFKVTTAGTSGATAPIFSTLPCASSPATVLDGAALVWTSQGLITPTNQLDCTLGGITCKRTAYFYLEGAGCNNTTPGLGWDTFGANSPTPLCISGANIQKGVMAFPAAITYVQENIGSASAATTCTTTYPAATVAGDLLEVEIAVDGGKIVGTVGDGTSVYIKATSIANVNTDLEIWYVNTTSVSRPAGTVLTMTIAAAQSANCAIDWKEYSGVATGNSLDRVATNTGTGTAVSTGVTIGLSAAPELALGVVASPGNPVITPQNTWTQHSTSYQVANLALNSEGQIQGSAGGTPAAAFTLGTSQIWAGAIATFKAAAGGTVSAQRSILLPAYFLPGAPITSVVKWQAPLKVAGVVNVLLTGQLVCTADGSTDDPAFLAATTATAAVSATGPVIVSTPLTNMLATGCAAGNILHYQLSRPRFNPLDTYEGNLYINGASLQFGITQ